MTGVQTDHILLAKLHESFYGDPEISTGIRLKQFRETAKQSLGGIPGVSFAIQAYIRNEKQSSLFRGVMWT